MARPPQSLTTLFLRHQNHRSIQNLNPQIRNLCLSNGGEEFLQTHQQPKTQGLTQIAKEVSRVIRTRPRWEQTLLSDFPSINLFDPNIFIELWKQQNNVLLSLRFYLWLSSQCSFVPDKLVCDVIFDGLVEAKAANAAKSFLTSIDFTPQPASLEAYVRCLCENGSIEEALKVFDELQKLGICPLLETWNSALLGSVRARRTDVVWKLYEEMMGSGVAGDVDTVEYLIQAFCIDNNVSKGFGLLRQVLEDGFVPSNVAFNKLISGFCKDRYYSRVSALLHTMIAKNQRPDIFTYQEIIRELCKRRMRHEGFRIFNDLKDRGYAPDRVMYTTMIHGLCKMKWIGEARKLWFEMVHKGIVPNEYTYNAFIYGLCRIGNLEEAKELYNEMCCKGYKETTVSCNTMIRGLCLHGRTEEAHVLFQEMAEKGIARDIITYNSLIQGFCKEGKIDESINLLAELLEKGLQPSAATYTAPIEKLCEMGDVDEAKELWEDMQNRGVEPAVCTRDFIITGLSNKGYVAEGMEWLTAMWRRNLKPQKQTFERLIQCLSQGDKLDEAILVLDYMFSIGYTLRECICRSLVDKLCEQNSEHVETCLGGILQKDTAASEGKICSCREGSARGFGIRVAQSVEGSDSWVDDPITHHIISLYINKEEEGENHLFWPLILHIKSQYCILVLPLVEPCHLKACARICKRSDRGNAVGVDGSVSSLLLDLPSITGYEAFMVAHSIGDVVTGDVPEPEVVVSASPSVGGLLDSLTGSIGISGISARAKPVAAPVAPSTTSNTAVTGAIASDAPKIGSRPLDKDALRTFISSSMPFGRCFLVCTPLDLNYSNISAIKLYGFASSDLPPADRKQPAWKPYLYKGKQRIIFTIHEAVHAAMYDRDEIPDTISISRQVNCRAELEGLPDVSFPMIGLDNARIEVLSFHPCAQVPEHGVGKQALMFSPPLGFYQLSMVAENEGAFLFKLHLMEGYKSPLTMEFCTATMPFPRRRLVSFDGTPSVGTVSTTEHSVEWKIITSGGGITGKSIEATFPGTVRFAPRQTQRLISSGSVLGSVVDEDSDMETEATNNVVNVEDFLMEKMNKDLPPVDLEEPFCWQAYNYAKVSFKIVGASLSGMSIDPKSVSIFPAVKAPVESSTQVTSGDYILWNTLGQCLSTATAKV
ncbi:unnamed protein product [Camellia sinensis]